MSTTWRGKRSRLKAGGCGPCSEPHSLCGWLLSASDYLIVKAPQFGFKMRHFPPISNDTYYISKPATSWHRLVTYSMGAARLALPPATATATAIAGFVANTGGGERVHEMQMIHFGLSIWIPYILYTYHIWPYKYGIIWHPTVPSTIPSTTSMRCLMVWVKWP